MQVERFDREHLSRKTSLLDNVSDIFLRKWAGSDPVNQSFDRKPNCNRCKHSGHWTVSFPKKKTFFVTREDDCIVENLLLNDIESEPDEQIALYCELINRN